MEQFHRTWSFAHIITLLQVFSLWLLIVSLSFRIGLFPRIAMIVAGVLFVTEYVVNKRWQTWKWDRNKWLYVVMIAYYLLIPIWHVFSDTQTAHFSFVMGERLSFVLCGIIGLCGLNKAVKLTHVAYVMLLTVVVTSLYIIFRGTGVAFFTSSLAEQSALFCANRILYVHSHMAYNLYMNITLIFAFYLLLTQDFKRSIRIALILCCVWIFYLLCLTEGRVGFMTGLLLVAFQISIVVYRKNWKWLVPVMIVYSIGCALIAMQHDRLKDEMVEEDPRWEIWKSEKAVIEQSTIFGHGVCDARSYLIDNIQQNELLKGYCDRIHSVYHGNLFKMQPHNAFLEAWAEFGLIGLGFLLFIFFYPLTMRPSQHRIYVLMIIGCFGLQSMFDSFFAPLLYSLAIILFTSQSAISKENVLKKQRVK